MSRFASTFQKDVMIQARNNMYSISLIVAVLFAIVFTFILNPEFLRSIIPVALLFIVGGTTIIFIGALIMDEKELGILNAFSITPLSIREYLWSKIVSLTFLATLEVGIMIGIPIAYAYINEGVALPNVLMLILGIVSVNVIYTVLGIGIVVRFRKLTDFLLPTVLIMIFLQVPILYYAKIITSNLILIIPSAAPIMLVQSAFNTLETWQWIYGIAYTIAWLVGLILWAFNSYKLHVVEKMR